MEGGAANQSIPGYHLPDYPASSNIPDHQSVLATRLAQPFKHDEGDVIIDSVMIDMQLYIVNDRGPYVLG